MAIMLSDSHEARAMSAGPVLRPDQVWNTPTVNRAASVTDMRVM
jgi:hypothetical protein